MKNSLKEYIIFLLNNFLLRIKLDFFNFNKGKTENKIEKGK